MAATPHFLFTERELNRLRGTQLRDPLRVFSLRSLGLDQEAFITAFSDSFRSLCWDAYDVRRDQIQGLKSALSSPSQADQDLLTDYYLGNSDWDELLGRLQPLPASLLAELSSLEPYRKKATAKVQLGFHAGSWEVLSRGNSTMTQNVDSSDIRSMARRYPDISPAILDHPLFGQLLSALAGLVRECDPSVTGIEIGVWQVAVVCRPGRPASNSPEGVHQDGADFIVSALVVGRSGISGGASRVYGPGKENLLFEHTLLPGEGLFQADHGSTLWHEVTAIQADGRGSGGAGGRDLFGFDINVLERQQRKLSTTSRIDYNDPDSVIGGAGAFGLPYHYEMLSDSRRVDAFRQAIMQVAKGKVVLESGTGTGVLSIIAARAGAKKVFACELDPNVAAFARSNIEKAGLGTKVTLLERDTRSVLQEDLEGQRAEVVIAENLSTWCVTEPQLSVMNHIVARLADKSFIPVPERILNTVELVEAKYSFEEGIELRTVYFEFSGIHKARVLSAPHLAHTIDLRNSNPLAYDFTTVLEVTQAGKANAVRLTSPLIVADGVRFESSDSLMPPVIVPLDREVDVVPGVPLSIRFSYCTNSSWGSFHVSVAF
jgi:predicted RNA methylase